MIENHRITLVGAGPGDPELITCKGVRALKTASVVLFDALVNPILLEYTPQGCKKVFVGKRKGKKEFSQEEINQLIVFYAIRYPHVVRLKGGDPYVFGRGHEEFMFASRSGFEVDVIPGVSSALAAPAAANIPVTKRGVSESFWVITGTLANGQLSSDIQLASQSSATIVILMGMMQLEKILLLFRSARSADEPIGIIEEATNKNQKVVIGTVDTILEKVRQHDIKNPAVIVIGKVVEEAINSTFVQSRIPTALSEVR
jgi:uroporphyrin-III C-methyltransferase